MSRFSGLGHVYQQRYKSFPIQDDAHFFVVCRYVERNALRAELVDRAEDWRWGSLWRWLQQPEPDPKLLSPWPMSRLPKWLNESMNHLQPVTWMQFDFPRSAGGLWETKDGWNPSSDDSSWNPQCVPVVDNEYEQTAPPIKEA